MSSPSTPSALLQALLKREPGLPLLTYYDDSSGERVELSVTTFANWVAKTANMIQDGLAAAPGERVALLLPWHWQTAVWLFACWSTGVVAVPGGEPATADVVVAGPDALDTAAASHPPALVALSLRPLGGPVGDLPPGAVDYAEVLGYPDSFTAYTPPSAETAAIEAGGRTWGAGLLVDEATRLADSWGIGRGDRVLVAEDADPAFPVLAWPLASLLAPIAAGAGIVLCRHLDEGVLPRRLQVEHVTGLVGRIPPPGTLTRILPIPS